MIPIPNLSGNKNNISPRDHKIEANILITRSTMIFTRKQMSQEIKGQIHLKRRDVLNIEKMGAASGYGILC